MTRIGIVTPGFSASEGDWSIPALLNSVRLLAQDHDVHIFTLRYPHRTRPYRVYGATVHPLGVTHARAGWHRLTTIMRGVASILRQGKFDVLHAFWADEPGVVATLAGTLTRTPVIVSLMGGEMAHLPAIDYGGQLSGLMSRMITFSTSRAAVVTTGSDWLAAKSPFPTQVIPLGVDVTLFNPDGETHHLKGEPALLHVASLSLVKNQAMLMETMALVIQKLPGAHLHFVGSGSEFECLQTLSRQLEIAAHITFHGDVAHHELPTFYRAADMCLLTSYYESQSMVALEAAACGKVTVGTRVGILPQLVGDEYLVDSDDANALAEIILQLWEDTTLLDQLSRESHRRVLEQFTLAHQIERWNRLYAKYELYRRS
ncbi:MAG: glycosyltransferase family 4 protein [Chloroflexi bacterium]|nr:glycosyltransferase family 4 protein [Chloroflexota bacterium]